MQMYQWGTYQHSGRLGRTRNCWRTLLNALCGDIVESSMRKEWILEILLGLLLSVEREPITEISWPIISTNPAVSGGFGNNWLHGNGVLKLVVH